ncbi:hypothetical protein F4778DRAFT_723225 [Xylariomycetidae sp. FL2044]|nr:hypothetical protein F4778DRAFT_723225 [Xylariomycetidae sp. FL2044]
MPTEAGLCRLETLPVDALVLILSASNSSADLHTLIRASPVLYRVFLLFKCTILLGPVFRDSGLVIRDYVALSLTPPLNWYQSTYEKEALAAIQQYQRLPIGRKAVAAISVNHAIRIIQFKRTVDFFVDLFSRSRLDVLSGESAPLSPVEYQHVSQALVRHQIFAHLNPGAVRAEDGAALIRRRLFDLFAAWEMEQVSVIHHFVFSIHHALATCTPKRDRILDRRKAVPVYDDDDDIIRYVLELDALRRKITTASVADPELIPKMKDYLTSRADSKWSWGIFNVLHSSHNFPKNQFQEPITGFTPPHLLDRRELDRQAMAARDALYAYEDALPDLVAGTSVSEPPYGWVDAQCGLDCRRWGGDLPRCLPHGEPPHRRIFVQRTLGMWRLLGFVFWDQDRVESLKKQYETYKTGWLTFTK